jgi:hypothetical protein
MRSFGCSNIFARSEENAHVFLKMNSYSVWILVHFSTYFATFTGQHAILC